MAPGGTPIYSNLAATKLAMAPTLLAGFLSAIQSFSRQLVADPSGGISEMTMHDIKILYRNIEGYSFIGLVDSNDKIKEIESVMEYIICAFLAKYRRQLHEGKIFDTTEFSGFDGFFEKWRRGKEKDLQKWCERVSPTLLQGVLNLLVNYFPAAEMVSVNPGLLRPIGRKLLWVDVNVTEPEEAKIFAALRDKVSSIYGQGMFEKIVEEARKNLATEVLIH
ncbi:MAG: hypothetical protein JW839_20465 [Candidatus Lokiarchaeota archaeon]|nr:hypothetical protein [Candidatus Lokiarchaeota archaeon]